MKLKTILVSTIVVVVMLIQSVVPAFAVWGQSLNLPAGQAWVYAGTDYHNPTYLYCGARCLNVSPAEGGLDLFFKIQCKVTDTSGTIITQSDYYVLNENASSHSLFPLKNGYLATTNAVFYFRGNSSSAANTEVCYWGTLTG